MHFTTKYRTRSTMRILLYLIALSLAGATGLLLISESAAVSTPPPLGKQVEVDDDRALPAHPTCLEPSIHKARLILTVTKLDLHALTVTLAASLCFPPDFLSHLHNRNGSLITSYYHTSPIIRVRAGYRSVRIGLAYTNLLPSQYEYQYPEPPLLEAPLALIVEGTPRQRNYATLPNRYINLGRVSLPIVATPRRYPFDWYAIRGNLHLEVEDFRVEAIPATAASKHNPPYPYLPFTTEVFTDPDLAPFVLKASTVPASEGETEDEFGLQLGLRLTREGSAIAFVAIVALVPLLLGLLMCAVLFRRKASSSSGLGVDVLTGVAAVLLAILPIRLVLVPAAVVELTLVDYWLGFVISLLAGAACVAVARDL
jgi:hypothetical protein